jgi:hypothetical protein
VVTQAYADVLEHSPTLLARLKRAAEQDLSLRGEVALARGLLSELLAKLAQVHGKDGKLNLEAMVLAQGMIKELSLVVERAAGIESKRVDQGLDAAKLVLLMTNLRNGLRQALDRAGFAGALPYIDAAFEKAKWTGDLSEEVVEEALRAPAAYDVKFRLIDRASLNDRPTESEELVDEPEKALRKPSTEQIDALKMEIAALESGVQEANHRHRKPAVRFNGNGNGKEITD